MIYEASISKKTEEDLRGIYEYIAFDLQAPEAAEGQLTRIEGCILSLEEMPERFRRYEKEPWKSRGLRTVPVDNFCIFYIPDEEKRLFTVVRVMHQGRDVDRQLTQEI